MEAFGEAVVTTPLVSYDVAALTSPFTLVLPILTPPSPPASPVLPPPPRLPPPQTPPWSPPRNSTARLLVASLNRQFELGQPSTDLAGNGVLVRQFDHLSGIDFHRPWEPCPRDHWCAKYRAQWPASIINPAMRHLYYQNEAGFVLNSDAVRIYCAYNSDGNSMSITCGGGHGDSTCIPGCHLPSSQCQHVHRDWTCSWPPEMLKSAMRAQLARGNPSSTHNEIVIDTRSVEEDPPAAILAFFHLSGLASREVRNRRNMLAWKWAHAWIGQARMPARLHVVHCMCACGPGACEVAKL